MIRYPLWRASAGGGSAKAHAEIERVGPRIDEYAPE
jgi:hypothetical protein